MTDYRRTYAKHLVATAEFIRDVPGAVEVVTQAVVDSVRELLFDAGWSRAALEAPGRPVVVVTMATDHARFIDPPAVAFLGEARALELLHRWILPDFDLFPRARRWRRLWRRTP